MVPWKYSQTFLKNKQQFIKEEKVEENCTESGNTFHESFDLKCFPREEKGKRKMMGKKKTENRQIILNNRISPPLHIAVHFFVTFVLSCQLYIRK